MREILIFIVCLIISASYVNASCRYDDQKIIFAIDGLSLEMFETAQKKGLFSRFKSYSRHIAPFPSMTDPSWTEVMGGQKIAPKLGKLESIEATYFDPTSMSLQEDPREVFNRFSSPFSYMRAFDYYFNPVLEPLMYFPGEAIADFELEEIQKAGEEAVGRGHYFAYVSSVDAVAHTQIEKIYPLLNKVDETVRSVLTAYEKQGCKPETWIISDHGNGGRFTEGERENYLVSVNLDSEIAQAGLVKKNELKNENEISLAVMALGNAVNVSFYDLSKRKAFAEKALSNPAVELAVWLEIASPRRKWIHILGKNGKEAKIHFAPSEQHFAYEDISGNPLEMPEGVRSSGALEWLNRDELLERTWNLRFPDAIYRLAKFGLKQVESPPDMVLSLYDGYHIEGGFNEYVKMVRTHGSLSEKSSLGILSTTGNVSLPNAVRGEDVLSWIGLKSFDLFHRNHRQVYQTDRRILQKIDTLGKEVPTHSSSFANDTIFMRIAKILRLTQDFFPTSSIQLFKELYKFTEEKQESLSDFDFLKNLDLKSILNGIDPIVNTLKTELDDGLDGFAPRLLNSLSKVRGLEFISKFSLVQNVSNSGPSKKLHQFRQAFMRAWSTPYFISEALNVPEFSVVPDSRNLNFAKKWKEKRITGNHGFENELHQELFREIFKEQLLVDKTYPFTPDLIYNPRISDVTVVFVPGIYNELFDKEIFSRGLPALRNDLGLRTLYADLDGRCSSEINSEKLLNLLKTDTSRQLDRGYQKPSYLLVGYSKGGIDSLEMILKDEVFTRSQIRGLVTIASPIHGTGILDKADLPGLLAEGPTDRSIPKECLSSTAAESLRPIYRANFLNRNLKKLSGLTRLFSLSFVSSIENAHPWMKITKQIARFDVPNDGVVTEESSKFPEALFATDLGTLEADHLSGILSSNFKQEIFLKSLLIYLFETHATAPESIRRWHESIAGKSKHLMGDFYVREFGKIVDDVASSMLRSPFDVLGPLPSQNSNEQLLGWYKKIENERALLQRKFVCKYPEEVKRFGENLRERLNILFLKTKSFKLLCKDDGIMYLRLKIVDTPLIEFWTTDIYDEVEIRSVGELGTELLSRGLLSEKNILEDQSETIHLEQDMTSMILPNHTFQWSPDFVIDWSKLDAQIGDRQIYPETKKQYPDGIEIYFNHKSLSDFRKDYQFSFESTSPGGWEDNPQGYSAKMTELKGTSKPALRIRSLNNSIRLTSLSHRFKPVDFPNFSTQVMVTRGATGADPKKGGTGLDDSAFQVWLTLRRISEGSDRSAFSADEEVKLFAYYWAEKDLDKGQVLKKGNLVESYYSEKNLVFFTLPTSWQIQLNGPEHRVGEWHQFDRNLLEDLKAAYPDTPVENWEVIGLTIQTDSNDIRGSTEAFFKSMSFRP